MLFCLFWPDSCPDVLMSCLSCVAAAAAGDTGAHSSLAVPEAIQQLAFADRILLNKIDLVTKPELQRVLQQVRHGGRRWRWRWEGWVGWGWQ